MLLFLLTLPLLTIDASVHDVPHYDVDVETILNAFGAPPCMTTCVSPFIYSLEGLWNMSQAADSMYTVCRTHSESRHCLESAPLCDSFNVFGTVSSSFAHRCDNQVALVKRHEGCLRAKADPVLRECDASCQCRSNISSFSQHPTVVKAANKGGNLFMITDQIGGLCDCFSCALKCVTQGLNSVCPGSGFVTLDAMLQPFNSVIAILRGLNPNLVNMVRQKVHAKCHFTVDPDVHTRMRKGDFSGVY